MKTADDLTIELTKAATIYGLEIPPARIAGYLAALLPMASADVLCRAVINAVRTCRFFPTPAEILEAAGIAEDVQAQIAWVEAVKAVSAGPARRDSLVTGEIRETVRLLGGWDVIGRQPTDKLHFLERRFVEIYPNVAAKVGSAQLSNAQTRGVLDVH